MTRTLPPNGDAAKNPAFVSSSWFLGIVAFVCVLLIGATGAMKYLLDMSAGAADSQNDFRLWSLGLLLATWISLVLTAAMAVAFYLSARNKQAAPLRALAQSVKNLSRGDMQTAIWGMERTDAIGELARAIDLARYHFSQLPDLSLMSDQGPVRLKFEGENRSLFQAMVNNISEEYERARAETKAFTSAMGAQQEMLGTISSRLHAMLDEAQKSDETKEQMLQRVTETLTRSASALASVEEKTSSQLGKIIPFMQERAQNMAEVTHIAGTQVSQTLQALLQTGQEMRTGAAQNQQAMKELAAATNGMSERLFAAVNLMQASGKALSEATEMAKSRFNESIDALTRGEEGLQNVVKRADDRLNATLGAEEKMGAIAIQTEESAAKIAEVVRDMAERHESLNEQVVLATHRMENIVASFDGASRAMTEAVEIVRRDGNAIGDLIENLRTNNTRLTEGASTNARAQNETVQKLAESSQILLQRLELQITQQAQATESKIGTLATQTGSIAEHAIHATGALAETILTLQDEQKKFSEMREKIEGGLERLSNQFESKTASSLERTEDLAGKSHERLSELSTHMETLMQRLSILGQLTGTLGSVAGQLGQIVPTLTQTANERALAAPMGTASTAMPEEILEEIQGQWHKAMMQIEAMHDQLAQLMIQQKDQLETRLMIMDKKIKAGGNEEAIAQQAAIMNEIVAALGKINDHVVQLEEIATLSEDEDAREA